MSTREKSGSEFTVAQEGWNGPWRLGDGYCGHCDRAVAFKDPGTGPSSWSFEVVLPDEDPEQEDWLEEHRFIIGVCPRPSCSGATLVHDVWTRRASGYGETHLDKREVIHPLASDRSPLSDEVPEALRRLYQEAGRIEYLSPNGAAFLGRRLLEQVLRDALATTGRLANLIDSFLSSEALPGKLDELMHDVRQFGNIAAHPGRTGDGEWIEVDQDEATYVLDVVSELLDHVYVRPKRRQAMRERWQAKRRGELPEGDVKHRVQIEPAPDAVRADGPSIVEPDDDLPF